MVRRGVLRVELDRTAELASRVLPSPVEDEVAPRERRVRFSHRLVERERLARVLFREREAAGHRDVAIVDLERIRIRESGVRLRIRWILGYRLLEVADGLRDACFRNDLPTFFAFLGAVVFLELATVLQIVRFVGALPPGSAIVFDYGAAASTLDAQQLAERAHVAKGLASVGEPVKTFFDTDALAQSLRQAGFGTIEDIGYGEMNARYFDSRADDLRVSRNGRRLVRAGVIVRRER